MGERDGYPLRPGGVVTAAMLGERCVRALHLVPAATAQPSVICRTTSLDSATCGQGITCSEWTSSVGGSTTVRTGPLLLDPTTSVDKSGHRGEWFQLGEFWVCFGRFCQSPRRPMTDFNWSYDEGDIEGAVCFTREQKGAHGVLPSHEACWPLKKCAKLQGWMEKCKTHTIGWPQAMCARASDLHL